MGYTRMAHFIAGFIITIGLLWRIIFAFFGNKYSRQVFIIPFWRKSWWLDLLSDFRWYLFLDRTPREHIGHNPLAQLGMMTCINLLIIMILTGFGMYVQSSDSVILQPFHLVVDFIYWIGDSGRDLHSYHRLGMLFLMCFIIIHLYMVIREEIMGKSTLVSTMFSRIPAAALRKGWLIMERIVVLGLGNILYGDEGFGVRVAERLYSRYAFPDNVEIVDAGTQGHPLLAFVERATRLLCWTPWTSGSSRGPPSRRTAPGIPAYLSAHKMSLHQNSFSEVLALRS